MRTKKLFLSHVLDKDTPTYGNRNRFVLEKKASIVHGDVANDSHMSTTVHVGTHIDMPYHFYEDGQTIEDFNASFWCFQTPAFITIDPKGPVVFQELIDSVEVGMLAVETDILVVKTGCESERNSQEFWKENPGFSPDLYEYLLQKFPKLRVFGFDSISVSSFLHREIGREAHFRFLNPKRPILLLEDMHLSKLEGHAKLVDVTILPLRIANCDGLPCTVLATVNEAE